MGDGSKFQHTYQEMRPAPPLRRYVECYWYARSGGPAGLSPVELLVPDLKVELIVNAGNRYDWVAEEGGEVRATETSSCIGMRATALAIMQPGRLEHFGIRFRPGGLAAFCNVPLVDLTQRCVDVRDLFGPSCRELEMRILDARNMRGRIAAADAFLIARIRAKVTDGDLARSCLAALLRASGDAAIADIARDHGVGYKRLERTFLRDVGLTPKHVAKVARLQRALAGAGDGSVSLAWLAAECGYSDQSHMTRDFTSLVGRSPRAFLAERLIVFETMKESGSIGLKPFDDEPVAS